MKKIAGLLLMLPPSLNFAFFCPTNFNQIDFGQTIDQVTRICGQPASQATSTKVDENVPQTWDYYPKSTMSTSLVAGTIKTSFAFDASGKLINISVNNVGVGVTNICGRVIQLGMTKDMVKSACGTAAQVNRQTPETSPDPTVATTQPGQVKVIEMQYNSNPPVKLIFENGVLTSKQ